MAVQLEFLKASPYFSGLSVTELESISKLIIEKTADRGEMLLLEGGSNHSLYFVVSGALKAFKTSEEGKEQILLIVRPGDSFNDIPVFDGNLSPVSVQAMGPVVIYELQEDALKLLLSKHPYLTLNVIGVLASRVRNLMELVEDLSFKQVIGRVAKILLENAADDGNPGNRLTQHDMAAMAGTAREVVGRSLKSLEESGAIKMDHHKILITNKQTLKSMIGASI